MATIALNVDNSNAKVTLTITFTAAVTQCLVQRVDTDGVATTIRSGATMTLTNKTGTIVDFEAPMDVSLYYTVSQVTPAGSETGTSSYFTLVSYGVTWLKDPATSTYNMRIDYVEDLQTLTRDAQAGVFNIIDRRYPIVVATRRHGWHGDFVCHTATINQRTQMINLLSRGQVLLLSTPGSYGIGNVYVSVGDVTEERVGKVYETFRRWTLPMTMVDRPAQLASTPLGNRWIDVETNFVTWNDLYVRNYTWDYLLNTWQPGT